MTKLAYKDTLIRAGLIKKEKGNIEMAEWIMIMNNNETPEIIENAETRFIQKRNRKEKEEVRLT